MIRSPHSSPLSLGLLLAVGVLLSVGANSAAAEDADAVPASPWAVPPEGCVPPGGLRAAAGEDARAGASFETGEVVAFGAMDRLRGFLPALLWTHRERFFYEGMRLEIGPCFRDYGAPGFYHAATERFAGQTRLREDGGIEGYVAGRPFPEQTIDPESPDAGLRWAWNAAWRYQGAGFGGAFRVTDLLGRIGRAEPFLGRVFKYDLAHRVDRPDDGYAVPFARGNQWVAGGRLDQPFDAREYAWRQYRAEESLWEPERSDDLHAYLPTWRRVRRINARDVEGLYMPSFSVGVVQNQQLIIGGGSAGGVAAAGGAGVGSSQIQTKRSGFEGLAIRPLLYEYRVVGLQDVLAPINVQNAMYPENPDREFGPWGLSFASDRWDLRRALVLEGKVKGAIGQRRQSRVVTYLDLQTLQPLYLLSYDAKDEAIDIGVYAGRWSEDRPDYPRWPDDPERPVRVIDSVGEAFANLAEEGSWRRESWSFVSVPPPDKELRSLTSVSNLNKGR